MKIDDCLSDNHISMFGCPATFLVVPGARTTKISNAVCNSVDCEFVRIAANQILLKVYNTLPHFILTHEHGI